MLRAPGRPHGGGGESVSSWDVRLPEPPPIVTRRILDLSDGIRRRHLGRWTLGYAAGAWLTLEVVTTLGGTWGWPDTVGRIAFVLLATGFPVTVVLAWFHGERGAQRVEAMELLLLAGLGVVGLGAAGVVVRGDVAAGRAEAAGAFGPAVDAAAPRSLVVLPFTDLSPGRDRAYLGDGIAETLINSLAGVEGLRVVARTSAFQFRQAGLDVREIAGRLGVATVLEGSVAQLGDRIRVTADLTDARSGLALWSERFDREAGASDLFALQDEVARRIVDALRIRLVGDDPIVHAGSRDPTAQDAYFLGLHHWTLRTTADIVAAAQWFRRAVQADSAYAEAWSGLALAYVLHTPSEYAVPGITQEEALDSAEAAANRALALDPTQAAAYTALGDAYRARGERKEAERAFRRAIALNPGYATAHHWLADLLMEARDGKAALEQMEIAVSLDPVAPAIMAETAQSLMMVARYDDAIAEMDRAVALHPANPLVRAWAFAFDVVLDRWSSAAEHLEAGLRIAGQDSAKATQAAQALRDPGRRSAVLRALAEDGADAWWLEGARDTGGLSNVFLRFLAARKSLGDDAAMSYLEATADGPEASTIYVPVLPALMGPKLVESPRGRRLMERLATHSP